MKRRQHERTSVLRAGIAMIAVSAGLGLALSQACVYDECNPDGWSWCDGNTTMRCVNEDEDGFGSGKNVVQTGGSCEDLGMACFEYSEGAYCGFPDAKCPGGENRDVCVGNLVGECRLDQEHPEYMQGDYWPYSRMCTDNGFECREVDWEYGTVCAYNDEPCEVPGERVCAPDSSDVLLECVDGVWAAEVCEDGDTCEENEDGTVDCSFGAAHGGRGGAGGRKEAGMTERDEGRS
ncbi:MAG: hypothetical protein PHU25_08965 [Deltaproteobacteria bacterium]|nr:hypothetical protein [Deltaproteobacteria bacterium]